MRIQALPEEREIRTAIYVLTFDTNQTVKTVEIYFNILTFGTEALVTRLKLPNYQR